MISSQMKDVINVVHHLPGDGQFSQVCLTEFNLSVLSQSLYVCDLAANQAVDHADPRASINQLLSEARSDEGSTTRDEDFRVGPEHSHYLLLLNAIGGKSEHYYAAEVPRNRTPNFAEGSVNYMLTWPIFVNSLRYPGVSA